MKRIAVSLMVIGVTVLFGFGALALPEDGLVLHYDFTKGADADDLSGNGNDGTVNGGAKAGAEGLDFDGADGYVVTPALEVRTGGEIPFTAMCWFKTDEVANGPLWMWGDNEIPSSSDGAEGPVGWRTSTKKFAAGFYQGGHFYADAEDDYADGEWHFVAQVGDVDTGYLFVDGEEISSTTAGYTYGPLPYLLIGVRTKNSGNDIDDVEYFTGSMKMIAVYNRVLDAGEIQAAAAESAAVSSSGKLAATWGQMKK